MIPDLADVDSVRNARILRLVLAHVEDESVPVRDVESVLEYTGADAAARAHVHRALAEMNIGVEEGPPSADVHAPSPTALTGGELDAAQVAARKVLHRDRREAAPWKRLLSAQEEVGLAVLSRGPQIPLSVELPKGYRAGLHRGDERGVAFDAFVLHNLRLVHSIALGWPTTAAMDDDDITQSGMVGLMRAVEKFDATKGLKFSTYASWWIRQSISRALADDGPLIRIPVHMTEKIRKVTTVWSRLLGQGGTATVAEVSAATGYDPKTVEQCMDLSRGVVSLDLPVGDSDGTTLADVLFVPQEGEFNPEEMLDAQQLRSLVAKGLAGLSEREARVLRLRAGFSVDEPMTLDAIGTQLGVTRERVRQIEGKAKMRLAPILADLGLRPAAPWHAPPPDNG